MPNPRPIPIDADHSSPIIAELVYRLKVRDVMTRSVSVCRPDSTMREIQHLMKERTITGVPVLDEGRMLGIVSVDDVIRALDEGGIARVASEYMTRNVIVLEDDMPLSFAISYFDKFRFGRFPVLNAGKELVGIITSRDILASLLTEINKEVASLEEHQATDGAGGSGFSLEYATRSFDFERAGKLSMEVKRRLKERSLPAPIVRRVAVASYELEMNQVVHSHGGSVRVTYSADERRVEIIASDRGPGIPDIEEALTEGYSTATEWVRSLGFGAGMGLPNTRRVADEFHVTSDASGTRVRAAVHIPVESSTETSKPASEEST